MNQILQHLNGKKGRTLHRSSSRVLVLSDILSALEDSAKAYPCRWIVIRLVEEYGSEKKVKIYFLTSASLEGA
ncbi:MAG: hypothetical protein NO474_00280 [Methanomassiliicoccales archaeon]|jgi:hypothetical protein|nr:hypothetical protein [Methanomassiliicoccales archaeon]